MTNLIIIQARMGSSRLPGKVLMELEGKSILEHIINFLKFSKLTDKIIVATTTLKEDDAIEHLCTQLHIDYFRGSSDDVLNRFYECAKLFKGEIIVRITCDNPLIDPSLVDEAINICKNENCDYVSNMINETFPLGYLVEVLKFDILKKNNDEQHDDLIREHVTRHIRMNPDMYKIGEFSAPKDQQRPEWRLTIDYKNDYQLMKKIFKNLYDPQQFISYSNVINFLDNNLELLKINKKE
jgi:spore coat polysaccharide biosynthesis protein SpsF